MTVYLNFLGDDFGESGRTFSREKNDYVEADDEQSNMLVDMEWHNVSGTNAAEWLERLEENDFLRHICLGEHYDETDKVFVDEEDLVNYQ